MFKILLALPVLLFAQVVKAYEDQVVSMRSDGVIPKIPAEFGQARLTIAGLGTSAPSVVFRIGEHRDALPACLSRLIRSKNEQDIQLTSSWYHDEKFLHLPYYLAVTFRDPGSNPGKPVHSGYSFTFNLHNAELLEVQRLEANWSGTGGHYSRIDPQSVCKAPDATQ